jgi:hypothetical protein
MPAQATTVSKARLLKVNEHFENEEGGGGTFLLL